MYIIIKPFKVLLFSYYHQIIFKFNQAFLTVITNNAISTTVQAGLQKVFVVVVNFVTSLPLEYQYEIPPAKRNYFVFFIFWGIQGSH